MSSNTHCPLCGKENNCCFGLDKTIGLCWCTNESFPEQIFERIPPEQRRKSCICQNCVQEEQRKTLQTK